MKTEIIKLDKNNIDMDRLRYAAEVLRGGGLVAFPTETVYGLGANALDSEAVKKIFEAKGRPSDNPLIVHIADKSMVDKLVGSIPNSAIPLMDNLWPGSLTLVMKKSGVVPHIITAGLDTVAVRMPEHPIALALIQQSGLPIAAPSANTSGKPSPTEAKHVIEDLEGKVDVIIDGGSARVGLESTVLDVTSYPPTILRPGGVTHEQLMECIGNVGIDAALEGINIIPRSPGMKYKHYSPNADVIIIEGELSKVVETINCMAKEYGANGQKVGILATEQTKSLYRHGEVISVGDRLKPLTIAAKLFHALREFDEKNANVILAEAVENTGIGMAVMNRLNKAAGNKMVKV